ncbi:MAG: 50S ribosomal protein L17 [Dehalococcoidia bacterium]
MRHRVAGRKLSRPTGPRKGLLRGLAKELIQHERIITTEPKAREARALVEQLITMGKHGTLHHRRLAQALLPDEAAVKKLFNDLATRYASRPGGYTRIIKISPRKGDAAPQAILELVS